MWEIARSYRHLLMGVKLQIACPVHFDASMRVSKPMSRRAKFSTYVSMTSIARVGWSAP